MPEPSDFPSLEEAFAPSALSAGAAETPGPALDAEANAVTPAAPVLDAQAPAPAGREAPDGDATEQNPATPPEAAAPDEKPWGKDPRFQEDNQAYKLGRQLLAEVQGLGYESIEDYQQAVAQQESEREQQTALDTAAADLQRQVDEGEISQAAAERLYQAEVLHQQTQAQLREAQSAQEQINRQMAEARTQGVREAIPGLLDAVPGLANVITGATDPRTVQDFTQRMGAFLQGQRQAAVDEYVAQQEPARPAPLSSGGAGYEPPATMDENHWPSLGEAMSYLTRR